jgi:hypothetical protein
MSTKTEKTILLSDMIRFRKSKEALDDLDFAFFEDVAEALEISKDELEVIYEGTNSPTHRKVSTERITHFHRLLLAMDIDNDPSTKDLERAKNFGFRMGFHESAIELVMDSMGDYPNKVHTPGAFLEIFSDYYDNEEEE